MLIISRRTVNAFGYISLVVLLSLFVLDWFGVLPPHLRMPLFFLAVALFMLRITLRLVLERQRRVSERAAQLQERHNVDADRKGNEERPAG